MADQLNVNQEARERIEEVARIKGMTPKEVAEKALNDLFGSRNRVILDLGSVLQGGSIEIVYSRKRRNRSKWRMLFARLGRKKGGE